MVDAGAETGVHAVEGGLDGGGFVGAQDHGVVAGGAFGPVVEEAAEADGIEGCFDGPGGVVFAAGADDGDVPGGQGGEGVADGGAEGGREGKIEECVEGWGGGEGSVFAGRACPGGGAEDPAGGIAAAFPGVVAGIEGEGFEKRASGGGLDFDGGE